MIIDGPDAYLAPQRGGLGGAGRVQYVGSTVEEAGFTEAVTASAAAALLAGAIRMMPSLAGAALLTHWCGFRPAAPDGLPLLGRTGTGVIAATGHFRNGIVLTPATAELVVSLVSGEPPPSDLAAIDLAAFAPGRFDRA